MTRIKSSLIAASLACIATTSLAHGEPPVSLMAALREQEISEDIASRDYVLGRRLGADEDARHGFSVKKGRTYLVLGVCDDDCGDIDLVIEDAGGNVLSHDEARGADPLAVFAAERTGRVSIVLSMKDCDGEACQYGLGFYALATRKPAAE